MTALELLRRLDRSAMDILFPEELACLCCDRPTFGPILCPDCLKQLEELRLEGPLCPDCGGALEENGSCRRCQRYGPLYARSVWRHSGAPMRLVHAVKDGAIAAAASPLAEGLADLAKTLPALEHATVTWVTMPKKRQRQRGIDHGRLLAEKTAALLELPCRQLLARTAESPRHTQRGLSGEERRKNLEHAFCCPVPVSDTVILIDDVMTTGSTGTVCTAVLREAGAERVLLLTATRA